jgi:hypothetical protein
MIQGRSSTVGVRSRRLNHESPADTLVGWFAVSLAPISGRPMAGQSICAVLRDLINLGIY